MAVEDPLIIAKVTFFSYICSLVEPYLKKYQTQKPMVPFMFHDLKGIIKSLLELVIKSDIMDKAQNAKDMIAIDLSDKKI